MPEPPGWGKAEPCKVRGRLLLAQDRSGAAQHYCPSFHRLLVSCSLMQINSIGGPSSNMIVDGDINASVRSLRARVLRQAPGCSTTEFAEILGVSYGSRTQWGFPDKGSLSAPKCHQIIKSLRHKGYVVTSDFLIDGDVGGLTVALADRIRAILAAGEKITDRQAEQIVGKMPAP